MVAFRFVWSLCFLIGASTHARDIWQGGLFPYSFVPFALNAFWTALLPLDFAAAILIWLRPKWGAILGLSIMISDVTVNSWTVYSLGHEFGFELWLQTLFLIFVLATFAKVSSNPAITVGVGHA